MNVKIVTKDCNLFFGEIKNVQSSESPSEFLRNHLHCQFIFFSLTKTFTSQFVNEDAFKNESDLLTFFLRICYTLIFLPYFLSSFLLLIKLIHEKVSSHLFSHKQIMH